MLIYIKPLSVFPELHSDRLFGAIFSAISELYPEKLNEIIENFEDNNPPFIISSAFPAIKIGDETDTNQQTGLPSHGTVFGGGKSNSAGSTNYDFTFESVTGDATLDINATGYDSGSGAHTFNILRSIFGSGNAAKISGDGIVNIINYGTASNVKNNVSIQRASQVTLNNCHGKRGNMNLHQIP